MLNLASHLYRDTEATVVRSLPRACVSTTKQCGALCGQVDILIVNCSLFNPTPSLSAMIVNHFKMASNVVTYNLNGMGCSAGVISISLARELLQVRSPVTCLKAWDKSRGRCCSMAIIASLAYVMWCTCRALVGGEAACVDARLQATAACCGSEVQISVA